MTEQRYDYEFVRTMPDDLRPNVLYISVDYLTTSHLCACGCGSEVVLPLHPTKWKVTFDGLGISMSPSIGSRGLACRSHYWIERGRVRWAPTMSDKDFARAAERDRRTDDAWHGRGAPHASDEQAGMRGEPTTAVIIDPGSGGRPSGRLARWAAFLRSWWPTRR